MANNHNNGLIPVNGNGYNQGQAYNQGYGYNQGNGNSSGLGQVLEQPVPHGGVFAPGVGYSSNFLGFGFNVPTKPPQVPIVHIENFYNFQEPGQYILSISGDIGQANIYANGNAQPMTITPEPLIQAPSATEMAPAPKKKTTKKANSAEQKALEAVANAVIEQFLQDHSGTTTTISK